MAYEVHLDVYDGPFDLLLQLITAREVDLYAVRLADVVDGFLAEMRRLEALDLEVATEFLLIAATLVELKCRRLLPEPADVVLDEELAVFEARDYLLARLVECKTFTAAAAALAALEEAASRAVARRAGPDERFASVAPDLLAGVSPAMLAAAARRALARRREGPPATEHVHDDEVSVADALVALATRAERAGRASFRDLVADAPSTAHVVASFLALLELYKQGLVDLEQATTFGELVVRWTGAQRASSRAAPGWRAVVGGVLG
ncbi:MAG TPA: ScpA family protein [Acidimicrobiales bacterium]|nr:ScpA family protein [Acidimicrobiales bacterium]